MHIRLKLAATSAAAAVVLVVGAVALAVAAGAATQARPSVPALAERLPADVFPESRNRLPAVKREALDVKGQQAYDGIVGDARRLTGLQGPGGVRLHSPDVAELTLRLNSYLRFESGLGARTSELAILVVARELDSQFEWTSHEPPALRAGVPKEVVELVKRRGPTAGLPERDAVVIELGREALSRRVVSSATYARALKALGAKDLVDLTVLMGEYSSTAVLLNIFDQQLPPGQQPLLPPR
jgi:4-carboxymuconolactone decarboxylase